MAAESTKSTKAKSGRTPEQQAARDARKAAKAAAAAETSAPTSTAPDADATANDGEASSSTSPAKKRKRDPPTGSELEIDVAAPAPLSKAEIRAARKAAKRGETAAITPKPREYERVVKVSKGEKESREGKGKEMEKEREAREALGGVGGKRQNSVWIGNLSFKTTPESLKEFLEKGVTGLGGKGEGCITRVNLPKKEGKGGFSENRGFAYVDFASPELQALGVQLSERPFEGRRLLIKKGDDHNPTPNARTPKPISTRAEDIGSASGRPETSSIYVGNLPFDVVEKDLRDLVEENAPERPAGEGAEAEENEEEWIGERGSKKAGLKKVRLATFQDTGRCKGFAFLDFISPRHAKATLGNRKNHYLQGRRLTLQFASEEAVKRSGGNRNKPQSDKPKPKRYFDNATKDGDDAGADVGKGEDRPAKRPREDKDVRGKKWESAGRPRPGAALAMAKRENVAIVEGAGEKITFD